MDMICDYDYWNMVLTKQQQKNIPMKDMFPEQMKHRPPQIGRKTYSKRIIRGIIMIFLDIIIRKLIHDSYVWILPGNKMKILVGTINKFAKKAKVADIIAGKMFYNFRLIFDGKVTYGAYSIKASEKYARQLRSNIAGGRKYPIIKIY